MGGGGNRDFENNAVKFLLGKQGKGDIVCSDTF